MCARPRRLSEANLYHITFRGVEKRIIFEEEADRHYLRRLIQNNLEGSELELYAWCFMSNHVHLLIHGDLSEVSLFMKQLLSVYARHFNDKYGRIGHLFQDRFGSVPITTEEQLLATVRYIHLNPLDIPNMAYETYPWSSYREYLRKPMLVETEFVLSLFSNVDDFAAFHDSGKRDGDLPDSTKRLQIDDIDAVKGACILLGVKSLTEISALGKAERDSKIVRLKEAGYPIKQISRITGINRNTVQRARS